MSIAFRRALSDIEDAMLAAMSPDVAALVRKDQGFKLSSVLQQVQDQKRARLSVIGKLQSVLTQVSEQKVLELMRGDEWGSW